MPEQAVAGGNDSVESGTRGQGWAQLALKALIALSVSVLALWWALRKADTEQMWASLVDTRPSAVAAYAAGFLAIHVIRVIRWGLYIRPLAPEVSTRAITAAANIGIPATFFIPLRLGEFVRPLLIARIGAPFGGAVSSVVVERIGDGLCAVAMFFLFFPFIPENVPLPDELVAGSRTASLAFGGGLIFLVAAAFAREHVLGLTRRILARISETLADRFVNLVSTFLDGLAALGSPARALAYAGLTFAFWFGHGVLIWLLASSYETTQNLPLVSGLFAIPVLVFAVTVPAGPAFVGTFQAGFLLGLGAFGVDRTTALLVSFVAQAIQVAGMALLAFVGYLGAEPEQLASRSDETMS